MSITTIIQALASQMFIARGAVLLASPVLGGRAPYPAMFAGCSK